MKILIAEDEFHIANYLEKTIVEFFQQQELDIAKIGRLTEAMAYVDTHDIELLMLDLNLCGKDGFDILKLITSRPFHTIIVSAYKDRAIEAFEYGVIDFVPKPFSKKRLWKALARLSDHKAKPTYPLKYFMVKKRGKILMIDSAKVRFIKAYGHYSKLYLNGDTVEVYDKALARLIPLLGNEYERIHKSYIVKLTEIDQIHIYDGGKYSLSLKDGSVIPLGRTRYKALKQRLFGPDQPDS